MSDQQKYTNKLTSKRVLVIGGTSGIGFSVAEAALEYGATVLVSSSNPDRINSTLERLNKAYPSKKSAISGHQCDLSNEDTLESNLKTLLDKSTSNGSEKLDHVVYSAADSLMIKPLKEWDIPMIRKAGTMRFVVPIILGKLIPSYIKKSAQSSYTITSGGIMFRPIPDWTVIGGYAAGLGGLTRGLALDLAPVRVNLVSPGAVDTELWKMPEEDKEKMFKSIENSLPTGAVAKPEMIAESYLYVMRDENVTGAILSTDGGHLLK